MHCFTILEKAPKWRNTVKPKDKGKGKGKGKAAKSTSTSLETVASTSALEDEEEVRPIGSKKAKYKRAREVALENSNEEVNKAIKLSLEEWSRSRKQKEAEMKVRSNDFAMSRNLSAITDEDELRYFTLRRKQILKDLEKTIAEENSNDVVVVEENDVVQQVLVVLKEDEGRESSSHIDLVDDDVTNLNEE